MGAISYQADDGVRVAYHDWNAGAGGPPIVLQHGFATTSVRNWCLSGMVEVLARGRRVIAVDARGHGESDKPRDPSFYGGVRLARDLSGVLDLLNVESYDLVGYSMGSMIAVLAAARDARVRRLVLSGTGAYLLERAKADGVFLSVEVADALTVDDPARITDLAGAFLRKVADVSRADRLALAALARSLFERYRSTPSRSRRSSSWVTPIHSRGVPNVWPMQSPARDWNSCQAITSRRYTTPGTRPRYSASWRCRACYRRPTAGP